MTEIRDTYGEGVEDGTVEVSDELSDRAADKVADSSDYAFQQYARALVDATGAILSPKKTKKARIVTKDKGSYEYAYAGADDIREAILSPLRECSLALVQPTRVDDGVLYVRTLLVHAGGHVEDFGTSRYDVTGQTIQQVGSAATYLRRYAALGALGLAPEDDDGAAVAEPAAPAVEAVGSSPAAGARRYPKSVRECDHLEGINEEGRCIGCGKPLETPVGRREGAYGP